MQEDDGGNENEREGEKTMAIFLAFGTQGDVYPLVAVAAGLAKRNHRCSIHFVTHAAHKSLMKPLSSLDITFVPITSPPVLSSTFQDSVKPKSLGGCKNSWKREIEENHREECLHAVDKIMGSLFRISGCFIINFFALEGWHLAELYGIPCIVAAPYVVPYSPPATFERRFRTVNPLLYEKLKKASPGKVGWEDVVHWMWPLFTEYWSEWRSRKLHLSPCPLTDPVTEAPIQHWPDQPLLLYGFSNEVVECPSYWPSGIHACGFWQWDSKMDSLIWGDTFQRSDTSEVVYFTRESSKPPIFIGLSSIGSLGFLDNPKGMLSVLESTVFEGDHRAILFTSSYPPLEAAILDVQSQGTKNAIAMHNDLSKGIYLFSQRLLCVSCSLPYLWLFPRCSLVIHHGGSGTTAAALKSGIPQVINHEIICPFILDQFYWAERMAWIGVAPEPLKQKHLLPSSSSEKDTGVRHLLSAISKASSPEIKTCAAAFQEKLSVEDGVQNAVEILCKIMPI